MKRSYINPSVELIDNISSELPFVLWIKSRKSIVKTSKGDSVTEINLSDNKLELVTESGSYLDPEEFYVGTELISRDEYKKRIRTMSLQYNNFGQYVFEINGSCLFRDILFNIGKVAQWAESNRFLFSILDENERFNSVHYKISSEYKDIPEWEFQFESYMNKIKEDPIVDHNRLEMPYSISSRFWISINRNTLVSVLSFLKYHAKFFYDVYGKMFMTACNISYKELRSEIDPVISQYIRNTDDFTEGVHKFNNFTLVDSKMGLILYSQFIRQTDTVISGLYDIIMHDNPEEFSHKVFSGKTEFMISYLAHNDKVKRTVSNRLCSFAMSSGSEPTSWNYFLSRFLKLSNPSDLIDYLPCRFKKFNNSIIMTNCKFHDDIKFRNEGKEISNCPCPLVSLSMSDAEFKKNRDKNIIGDSFYELTEIIRLGNYKYKTQLSAWTSELIILHDEAFHELELRSVMYLLNDINNSYPSYKDLPDHTKSYLEPYTKYGLGDDITCMMKGYMIDFISKSLVNSGAKSFVISFGGDILGYNAKSIVSVKDTKIDISLNGYFSVFTSGNDSNRGDHIVGGKSGEKSTVIVKWSTPDSINNTAVDILSTKVFANEITDVIDFIEGDISILGFNSEGKITNKTYCASPFFNDKQISTRDAMISNFTNVFRPDLTASSLEYNKDSSKVDGVVSDNIYGIKSSDLLVFPVDTDDLGTLYEVGYAMAANKPIVRYNELGRLTVSLIDKDLMTEVDINKNYLFDCSKKSDAIMIGYASYFTDKIYYNLNGCRDNIMLSVRYTQVKLVDGKYIKIERNKDERDC